MVLGILTITLTMVSEGRTFEEIIPVLTLFGVAAVKLMPVFNGMINDITSIRYSAPSVYAIYDDLDLLENRFMQFRQQILSKAKRVELTRDIELDNISYKYPGSADCAVKDISPPMP